MPVGLLDLTDRALGHTSEPVDENPQCTVPFRLEAGSSREFSIEISDWDAPFALAAPRSLKAASNWNGSTGELADISSERFMKQVTQMNYLKMGIEARGHARPSENSQ
jgi:hypothetical protein